MAATDTLMTLFDFTHALACDGLHFKSIVVNVDEAQFQHWLSLLGSQRGCLPYGWCPPNGEVVIDELHLETSFGKFIVRKVLFHV